MTLGRICSNMPSGAADSLALRQFGFCKGECDPSARGSVLLEVILALALFVTAAAIVTSGMNASADSLQRQRLNTHAGNLAATVIAEIQLGIRSTAEGGEQPFLAPFDKWTSELIVAPAETETGAASGLLRVEVIIRHQEAQLVRRLSQVVRIDPNRGAPPASF